MKRQKHLLLNTSALTFVTALGVLTSAQAVACVTVSSNTVISTTTSCVSWNSGNLGVANTGRITGGSTGINTGNTLVGTLVNNGTINGNYLAGILNNSGATITTITNNSTGSISGGGSSNAIQNSGSIGVIINNGTIGSVAGAAGIGNPYGIISTIINNGGAAISDGATGIYNGNILNVLQNSGTISGYFSGLSQQGTVLTITNNSSGTFIGHNTGIYNNLSIDVLTNSGMISGTSIAGINNDTGGTIGLLDNSSNATINGGSIGILNSGTLASISNSGTITGTITGIFNTIGGSIGTLSNFGTISATKTGVNFEGFGVNNAGTINQIVNDTGAVIYGGGTAIANNNGGVIGTITNRGTLLSTGSSGIWNNAASTIGLISNSGTISSALHGIQDDGSTIGTIVNSIGATIISSGAGSTAAGIGLFESATIGTISNSGTISGFSGILNSSGTIGTIINNASATIVSGGSGSGIINEDSIGLIINSGVINAIYSGIYNSGTIGAITNAIGGTIDGSSGFGIYNNAGTIETISNAGTISGSSYGIFNNNGSIGTISNSGKISGNGSGIYNTGAISSLTNTGLIEGSNAIYSSGTIISALSNTGTLAGNIYVQQALTITGGSIGGLGTLTGYNGMIGTITTNNHDLTFDANAYQLLDDDINVGASNTVFNNGLIRVNTTHSITGNYTQSSGGTLVVGVTDPTHYGQLIVSGAAVMTGSNVLIAPTSGSLSSGETLTIVQAATSGTNYAGIVATANGFTVTTSSIAAGGFEDLIISLSGGASAGGAAGGNTTYMQTGALSGGNGSAVGTALDQLQTNIANGGNTSFAPVLAALNTIGVQQGAVAEGAAIKQLAPGQLSASVATTNLTALQSMTVVGQHQQNIRSSGSGSTGRSSGSEYTSGTLWMQVDGGFANSTTADAGYHQSYYGMTFGADDHVTKNATLGMAFSWGHNSAQGSNDLSGDSVTTSTPELMGYGSYRMGQAYIDGMVGVGYNMFNQSRSIGFLNSVATSKYGGMQYMGNVETGYDFAVTPRTTMTPLIGFNAVRTDTNGYTENGAGAADTSVGRQIVDSYATLLGGRVTTAIPTAWGSLMPEARLAWAHDLNGSPISSNATLQGVNFATTTPRSAQDGAEVSLGATLERSDALSLRAEYDGDLRSDFQSHIGLLKGSWKF